MARRRSTRRNRAGTPGWVWMLVGLAVGLSIAMAIHLKHRGDATQPPQAREATPAATSQPAPAARSTERPAAAAPASEPESRFDFYELLPQFEVVLPERETPVRRSSQAPEAVVDAPGSYVLQAGSFRRYEDADRMRANLALRGIESNIQRVQIDQDTFHRVRIGPIEDLTRLELTRGQLRDASIDVLLIRVPD